MSKDRYQAAALVRSTPSGGHRGLIVYHELEFPCALGRTGITASKREGDSATPAGRWPFRRAFYRADRMVPPRIAIPTSPLSEQDGWCDAPADLAYNRYVTHPYPASAERLWRVDHVYDLIVVLGHNDEPPVPGLGSAIFMHVARPDYEPTAGCIALALSDLLRLLEHARAPDCLDIASSA